MKRTWIWQVLIALDQLVNALFFGWADETISARAYRQKEKTRWFIAMKFIDMLFFWQDQHCKLSYEQEKERHHLAPEYRKRRRKINK